MKTTNPLAALFARSPFGPIQEHMRTVERCALELPPLIDALAAGDLDAVEARRLTIFALEEEADDMKNDVRSALPSTLLLPVARRDLLDLLATQDAIADATQDAAGLVALAGLRIVPPLHEPLREFCAEVTEVVSRSRGLVDQLDELLEVGFRGREADKLLEMIDEVARLEAGTDARGMALAGLLFEHQDDLGPLAVVFWYDLVRIVGRIADEAENVGDRLRLLIAR